MEVSFDQEAQREPRSKVDSGVYSVRMRISVKRAALHPPVRKRKHD